MKIHKIMALMKRNLVSSLGLYFLANSNAMICLFDYFPSKQIVDQAKKISDTSNLKNSYELC